MRSDFLTGHNLLDRPMDEHYPRMQKKNVFPSVAFLSYRPASYYFLEWIFRRIRIFFSNQKYFKLVFFFFFLVLFLCLLFCVRLLKSSTRLIAINKNDENKVESTLAYDSVSPFDGLRMKITKATGRRGFKRVYNSINWCRSDGRSQKGEKTIAEGDDGITSSCRQ